VVDKARAVVLRMDGVPVMDATGLVALESALAELQKRGCFAVITGLQAQPRRVLQDAHIEDRPGQLLIREDIAAALIEIERRPAGPDATT
jgi:SulP family sulfate permease